MYQVTSKGYARLLQQCWKTKIPLYIYGAYGCGKSAIPRQVFKKIAEEKKLKFVNWEETTNTEKLEMIKNADDYFCFCDQRVAQMDSTDLRGIPNMQNTDMLQTIPYAWVIYFTQPKAHGLIFFDELNLSAPTVAGSAYQIIHDRTISDRKLGEDVLLIGAGNRECDRANVFSMPFPLKDRFCECEMAIDSDEWCEWALQYGEVNPLFVAFIKFSPSSIFISDVKKGDKPTTPRSIVRANKMIGDYAVDSDDAFELISIASGEAFAVKFRAFAKCHAELNWKTIYEKPETIKDFTVDKLCAVAGGITDQFIKGVKEDTFNKMMDVVMCMKKDIAIVNLKMMKDANKAKFVKAVKTCKNFNYLVKNYAQYIIE